MSRRPSPRSTRVLAEVPPDAAAAGLSRARAGRPGDRPRGLDQHRDHRARRRDQRRRRPERRAARHRPGVARAGPGLEPRHRRSPGTATSTRAVWQRLLLAGRRRGRATGRVYLSPTAPFGWIDRPPSLNRLIGLQLAGRPVLSRTQLQQDLRAGDAGVLRAVLPCRPHDAELDRLLEWAEGRAPQQLAARAGAADHAAPGAGARWSWRWPRPASAPIRSSPGDALRAVWSLA